MVEYLLEAKKFIERAGAAYSAEARNRWTGSDARGRSAYLTVSETFPLEIRALAIAFFCAVGTGIGGVVAPTIFGMLIETGSRVSVAAGYMLGAALMLAASIIAARFCIPAERNPLEAVAPPLSAG
jgi:hypothetical protein